MLPYVQLISHILEMGNHRGDRTGTGTISSFGDQLYFDLSQSFPLLTLKKTNYELLVDELVWFLRGHTNIKHLRTMADGKTIWSDWAAPNGECGPIYGSQWRSWRAHPGAEPIDQITDVIKNIHSNPFSRRHIVSTWNCSDLPDEGELPHHNAMSGKMALAPCHTLFQFYVTELTLSQRIDYLNTRQKLYGFKIDVVADAGYVRLGRMLDIMNVPKYQLHCKLYQRSADLILGVPFNIASYATLVELIVNQLNAFEQANVNDMKNMYTSGKLIISFGDVHIYNDQLETARALLARAKQQDYYNTASDAEMTIHHDRNVRLKLPASITAFSVMNGEHGVVDIVAALHGYNPLPYIKVDAAV